MTTVTSQHQKRQERNLRILMQRNWVKESDQILGGNTADLHHLERLEPVLGSCDLPDTKKNVGGFQFNNVTPFILNKQRDVHRFVRPASMKE